MQHEQPSYPTAPAGWHVDPRNDAFIRYWDGQRWTAHTSPNPEKMRNSTVVPASPSVIQQAGSREDRHLHPIYQQQFAQFDADPHGSKTSWSWPAFLFGMFWYFAKGMWAKALIYMVAAFMSAGLLGIPLAIYAGLLGRHDYYLKHRHGNQLW